MKTNKTLLALAIATALTSMQAKAADVIIGDGAIDPSDIFNVTIGEYANDANQDGIADFDGHNSVAIGRGANANTVSTAIGSSAGARGLKSTAIGQGALSLADESITIGHGTLVGGGINNSSSSIAIGNNSRVDAFNSVAIGAGTVNNESSTVAIGNRRLTQVADAVNDQDAVNKRYLTSYVSTQLQDTLNNIEIDGITIRKDANGDVDVNEQVVGNSIYNATTRTTKRSDSDITTSTTIRATDVNTNTLDISTSIQAKDIFNFRLQDTISLLPSGSWQYQKESNYTINSSSHIQELREQYRDDQYNAGYRDRQSSTNLSIGRYSISLQDSTHPDFGNIQRFYNFDLTGLSMSGGRITGLAAGINSTDAVNKAQLDAVEAKADLALQQISGGGVDLTPLENRVTQLETDVASNATNISTLEQNQSNSNTVSEEQYAALDEELQRIKRAVRTTETNETVSVQKQSAVTGNYHGMTITDTQTTITGGTTSTQITLNDDTVDFKHVESGAAVRLTGVADGVNATDAVNVSQVDRKISTATASYNAKFDALRSDLSKMEDKLNSVDQDAQRGIAGLAAITNAPAPSAPGKWTMAVGSGAYKTQSAVGISFAYRAGVNAGNAVISGGVGFAPGGDPVMKVGVAWELN